MTQDNSNVNGTPEAVEIEDSGINFDSLPSEISLIEEGVHNFMIMDIKLLSKVKNGMPFTTRAYSLKIVDESDPQDGKTIIDNMNVGNEFSDVRQKELIISAFGDTKPPTNVRKEDLLGKMVCAEVIHNSGKGQNAGKKYANIKAYHKNKPSSSGVSTSSNSL